MSSHPVVCVCSCMRQLLQAVSAAEVNLPPPMMSHSTPSLISFTGSRVSLSLPGNVWEETLSQLNQALCIRSSKYYQLGAPDTTTLHYIVLKAWTSYLCLDLLHYVSNDGFRCWRWNTNCSFDHLFIIERKVNDNHVQSWCKVIAV